MSFSEWLKTEVPIWCPFVAGGVSWIPFWQLFTCLFIGGVLHELLNIPSMF